MTQTQTKQQPKTGSGTQTVTMATKTQAGKTYGPGDGTGNQEVGPKDGAGYGAPANRQIVIGANGRETILCRFNYPSRNPVMEELQK